MHTALVTAAEASPLPMAPAMFAVIAIVVFVSLLGLVYSFRGNSSKHD
jgi:hypothetical protein